MGAINPNYPIYEVALSVINCTDILEERKKEGDIIEVRVPEYRIGTVELSRYLWLCLEGLEENEMVRLKTENFVSNTDDTVRFDKRRYCIPFERLKDLYPSFDLNAVRDPNIDYQPFLVRDDETGNVQYTHPAFFVSGLVFDKQTMQYL